MSSDKDVDPTQTYVLEETAITRISSLEELAERALRQDEKSRGQHGGVASDGPGRTIRERTG